MALPEQEMSKRLETTLDLLRSVHLSLVHQSPGLLALDRALSELIIRSHTTKPNEKLTEEYDSELLKAIHLDLFFNEALIEKVESEVHQAVISHLTSVSAYFKLSWHIPEHKIPDIEFVKTQWEQFTQQFIPATDTRSEEELPLLSQKTKRKSKKQAVILDQDEQQGITNPVLALLYAQINTLRDSQPGLSKTIITFKTLCSEHNALLADEKTFQQKIEESTEDSTDSKYESLKQEYAIKTQEAAALIQAQVDLDKQYAKHMNQPTFQLIGHSLLKTMSALEQLNHERVTLGKAIQAFEDRYYPQINDPEQLNRLKEEGITELEKAVTEFLQHFTQIEFKKPIDKSMQYFYHELEQLTDSIAKNIPSYFSKNRTFDGLTQLIRNQNTLPERFKSQLEGITYIEAESSYHLVPMPEDLQTIQRNELAIKIQSARAITWKFQSKEKLFLQYAVLDPHGQLQQGQINSSELAPLQLTQSMSIENLSAILTPILMTTAQKLHTKSTIGIVLNELFEATAKQDSIEKKTSIAKLKKQISEINYQYDQIKQFPIQLFIDCFAMKKVINELYQTLKARKKIHELPFETFKTTIEQRSARLNESIRLLGNIETDSTLYEETIEQSNRLTVLTETLHGLKENAKQQFLALPRLQAGIQSINDLSLLKETIQKKLTIQADFQAALRTLILMLKESSLDELEQNVSQFYEQTLKNMSQRLSNEITQATAALDFENRPSEEIAKILKPHHQWVKKLSESHDSLSLSIIKTNTDKSTQDLQQLVNETKSTIQSKISVERREISTRYDQFNPALSQRLSRINPYGHNLLRCIDQTTENINHYFDKCGHLKAIPATQLRQWNSDYLAAYKNTNDLINQRTQLNHHASIIEQRIQTPHYRVSMTVIHNMTLEFNRIFNGYIDKNRSLTPALKSALKAQQQQNQDNDQLSFSDDHIRLLRKIDPRLPKLLWMYKDFVSLNESYISLHYERYPDNVYQNQIKSCVERHFRNARMEDLSDNVNNVFYQWVRKHIVKPLTTLFHQQDPSRFFSTMPVIAGACKTERKFIELGNTIYGEIAAPLLSPRV